MRGSETALSEYIDSYLLTKSVTLRPATLRDYQFYLREYDRETGHATLRDLSAVSVSRYLAGKQQAHPAAARLAGATLKAFGSWLADADYLTSPRGGSVLRTVKVKRLRQQREPFSDEEVRRILAVVNTLPHRTRWRDRAIVLALLGTGLRANELRELRLSDLHIQRPIELSYLDVRAETSKSKANRQVRLGPLAASAVRKYIDDDRPNALPEGPVFLTEEGKPFSYHGFQNYLARIRDRFEIAGIAKWMAHRCRHTWATNGHRAGLTLFDLQAEGGWRDLSMVQHYTHARPFEELQHMPTSLDALLRRKAG